MLPWQTRFGRSAFVNGERQVPYQNILSTRLQIPHMILTSEAGERVL